MIKEPKGLLGKRILISKPWQDARAIWEALVIETSPSGVYLKLKYEDGETEWVDYYDIKVKAILEDRDS